MIFKLGKDFGTLIKPENIFYNSFFSESQQECLLVTNPMGLSLLEKIQENSKLKLSFTQVVHGNDSYCQNTNLIVVSVIVDSISVKKDSIKGYDQMPEFPGGESALALYISNHIRYPKKVRKNNNQRIVTVEFTVPTDGSISYVKAVPAAIGEECEEEAVRVVKSIPKWKAGKQNGKPVNVIFHIPVRFF